MKKNGVTVGRPKHPRKPGRITDPTKQGLHDNFCLRKTQGYAIFLTKKVLSGNYLVKRKVCFDHA
ncbi:MAG: hypothetical protein HGJ94_04495 [Desulfosarcina sp.]|nr:hypothetical protein [Desulfosarcina sp.]